MAASAGFNPEVYEGERYCGSLVLERKWARFLIALTAKNSLVDHSEFAAAQEASFDDHITAMAENIVTSEEDKRRDIEFVFGAPRKRQMIDGKIVSKDGQLMEDILTRSLEHSRRLAESDPTYRHQSDRDAGDKTLLEIFQGLKPGETANATSFVPEEWYEETEGTQQDGLCDSIGYRQGMSVVHIAWREDEDTMLVWPFSIKQSDKHAMSQVYDEMFGMLIPPDTHSDFWINHVHKAEMSKAEVEQLGWKILRRHSEIIGSATTFIPVEGFLDENIVEIRNLFDAYMPRIAESLGTGSNDPYIKSFASEILTKVADKLKDDVKDRLSKIASSDKFEDDDARLMKIMLRYATLEKIRPNLAGYVERFIASQQPPEETPIVYKDYYFISPPITFNPAEMYAMNRSLAASIAVGVNANRSPGGCSPISLTKQDSDLVFGSSPLRNDIFKSIETDLSGAQATEHDSAEGDEDGPYQFKCPKGHNNDRRRSESGWVYVCQELGCNEDVSCGRQDPTKQVRKKAARVIAFSAAKAGKGAKWAA